MAQFGRRKSNCTAGFNPQVTWISSQESKMGQKGTIMQNDQKLIGYCGIYCGDCPGYKGNISDRATDLRKELQKERYDKFAEVISKLPFGKAFENYDKFSEILDLMADFRCTNICRDSECESPCEVRKCCFAKEIEGCWECDEFETCTKLDFLKDFHEDAHLKNLRVIKRDGKQAFIDGVRCW